MKLNVPQTCFGLALAPEDGQAALLRELVAHLRQNRPGLRGEWARRVRETGLLQAVSDRELLSVTTAVYDEYVEVLETGSVEALKAYARDLFERILPRGVETEEVLGLVLILRDVLARSLFQKYHDDFEMLNRVLDAYEPAANRIANTVGVSFVDQRERVIRLRNLYEALEQRHQELASMNRELERGREHYRLLFLEARRMQGDLRVLSNRILRAQEEERKRISRELHDEVGQALTAVGTHLAVLQRGLADSKSGGKPQALAALKRRMADARRVLIRASETVRTFASVMRPAMLDELGLVPALRSYIREYAERTGLDVRFDDSGADERLNAQQKIVLFRVAQESLTNVARHAQASQVKISLRREKKSVLLRIGDNGRGFAQNAQLPGRKKHLGLLGMQERVRLVNGRFSVESVPGSGTTVSVEIPLKTRKSSGSSAAGDDSPVRARAASDAA